MVIRPLSETLQKVAQEDLNEDPNRIENDLQTLRTWISEQPHLKSRTDDQFLVAFLRNSKYDLEEAKQKLDNYYAYIEKYPDILRRPRLDEEKVHKLLKLGVVIFLPQPVTDKGPRVLLVRNGAFDPTEFSFSEIMQFRQLLQDILLLEDDMTVITGLIFIMDFSNVGSSIFFQTSPGAIKKCAQYTEEALPFDLKATHFINTPVSFTTLYNWCKAFMPARVQNKMLVHGSDLEELYKSIPQEILPLEYGGNAGPLQILIDQWEQKVLVYSDYFQDNDKYGVNESLRLENGESSTRSKFLGIF